MIDQINGIILNKKESYVIMMVGGIGLKVNMSVYGLQTLPKQGDQVQISTYLHVREDILDLYGFSDVIERNTFHLLTSISGIGPKLALTILSGIEPRKLKDRVVNGDVAALTSVPGVGIKTAKRIIIELKEKFTKSDDISLGINDLDISKTKIFKDAVDALESLGYKKTHAVNACKKLQKNNELVGELESVIKKALKILMS
jgi:Holliday junction DNA helicase RuvA